MNLASVQNLFSTGRPCTTDDEKHLSDEKSGLSQWYRHHGTHSWSHAYVLLNYESLRRVIVENASPALSYSHPTLTKSGCFRFRRYNELQHPWLSRSSYRPTRRWLDRRPTWRCHLSFSIFSRCIYWLMECNNCFYGVIEVFDESMRQQRPRRPSKSTFLSSTSQRVWGHRPEG